MTERQEIADLNLSDSELIRVLKNHGMGRRSVMKVIGAGAGVAALGGTATGSNSEDTKIDRVYGATFAANVHTVPEGLVDHEVGLHIHEEGHHDGFPRMEGPGGPGPGENGSDGPETDEDGDGEDGTDDEETEGDGDEEGPPGGPPEGYFDPVGLRVEPGDVVKFTTHGTGLHTVTSFHPKYNEPPFLVFPNRVPSGAFTSPPVAEGDSWLYRFTENGVYDLLCLPHLQLGMVMRVVVFREGQCIESSAYDEPEADPEAPLPPNAATVLEVDELDPGHIVSEGAVTWEELSL